MTDQTIETVDNVVNEYYKLKNKYETEINNNKRIILNNKNLSNKEKRSEFQKLKPKCVNCHRHGGTIFSSRFFDSNDKESEYRELKAQCGVISEPCNLDITLRIGTYKLLPDILAVIEDAIRDEKNIVIDDKNKLLFGFITAEQALEKFDENKSAISDYTGLLEDYLKNYIEITDNEEKKKELNEDIETSYMLIRQIKECIIKYNETNNNQYPRDAVNIYVTTLKPLLAKIASSKYKENAVYYNDDSRTYHLIQNRYTIKSLEYTSYVSKVVNYNVGLKPIVPKKKSFVIESDDSSSASDTERSTSDTVRSTSFTERSITDTKKETTETKPALTEKNLMESLPPKLKFALTYNNEWKKLFIDACLKARADGEKCKFIAPDYLHFPPEKSDDGSWLFGEYHYNMVFNKLPEDEKKRVLDMFTIKDGVKDYTPMEDYMNELVAKNLGFEG